MKTIIIESLRNTWKLQANLYNCDENYLKTVKNVVCIHPANHSVSLFLKVKDSCDLALYCHPLLAKESSKDFIIEYTQKYKFPLVILTRMETLAFLLRKNGVPHKYRRWCTRIFKIEPTILFYKTFIPSGVIEYMGMQSFQSKERAKLIPVLHDDIKSQKRYKIFSSLPIFYESELDSLNRMESFKIKPFGDSIRSFHRYGCFLCPFAGEKYYIDMVNNNPELYNECCKLMEIASEKQIKDGSRKERYYFYPKSKIM